jgi:lysophospholipase L1-like esterase
MASRRLLTALLALALLALAPLLSPAARAADPPPARVGPGDLYLALGDSLATGDEAAVNDDKLPGYPAYLRDLLVASRPISYTNLGVSGETSTSMRAAGGQLDKAVAFIAAQRAAGRTVSPVTLSVGGNDAVGLILPGATSNLTDTLVAFRANYQAILDALLAANSDGAQRRGDLIVMNYYNPYPGLKQDPFYGPQIAVDPDTDLPKFNQIIAEEAGKRGVPVVDAYSAFRGREAALLFVKIPYVPTFDPGQLPALFDYHPREAGHRLLAERFALATGYAVKLPRAYLPLLRQ